jgi:predicted RNA-binding Zn ribbon-like protein
VQIVLDDYTAGATVATDLVNTAPEVMTSTGELLRDPADLQRFLVEHGVEHAGEHGLPTVADVRAVRELRGTLRALLEEPDPAVVAERAGAIAAASGTGPALRRGVDGHWSWVVQPRPDAGPADRLALLTTTALLSVLRVLGPGRFRPCASPTCAGMFVDTSRAGRRRYCVPEVCGNRVNVAKHRAWRRAGRPPGEAR